MEEIEVALFADLPCDAADSMSRLLSEDIDKSSLKQGILLHETKPTGLVEALAQLEEWRKWRSCIYKT